MISILLAYKAEFPDGYICHNPKHAVVEALRSNVIDFEYEDLLRAKEAHRVDRLCV